MDEQFINDYKAFLDSGKTERECVESIKALAEKHGYKDLASVESVNAGSRVYVTKMNKSIALFELGSDPLEKGMDILGAHIDSPRLDVKQNPIMEKDFICFCARCGKMSEMQNTGSFSSSPTLIFTVVPSVLQTTP